MSELVAFTKASFNRRHQLSDDDGRPFCLPADDVLCRRRSRLASPPNEQIGAIADCNERKSGTYERARHSSHMVAALTTIAAIAMTVAIPAAC
jgi:hypothetical protein